MESTLIKSDELNYHIPSTWNYDKSVKRVKGLVFKWKNISVEILKELYIARESLSKQGVRNDLSPNGEKLGWTNYLNDVGLPHETVRRWLKQYDYIENTILPKEIEGNGLLKTEHKCPNCEYEW
jgi:hypothetical protein